MCNGGGGQNFVTGIKKKGVLPSSISTSGLKEKKYITLNNRSINKTDCFYSKDKHSVENYDITGK